MTTIWSRRVLSEYVVPAATLVGVLVVWEIATHAFRVPRFVMPPPSAILAAGVGVALSLHRPTRG